MLERGGFLGAEFCQHLGGQHVAELHAPLIISMGCKAGFLNFGITLSMFKELHNAHKVDTGYCT